MKEDQIYDALLKVSGLVYREFYYTIAEYSERIQLPEETLKSLIGLGYLQVCKYGRLYVSKLGRKTIDAIFSKRRSDMNMLTENWT